MKIVHDGKVFDTSVSEQIARRFTFSHGPIRVLYRTPKGTFFLIWERTADRDLTVLNRAQAYAFTLEHADYMVSKIFPDMKLEVA